QVECPGVTVMRVMGSEITDEHCAQFEFHCVTKGFRKEQDPLAVMRPIGPFAKPGHSTDVRRQMIRRTFAGFVFSSVSGKAGRDRRQSRKKEAVKTHDPERDTGGICSTTLKQLALEILNRVAR